MDYEFKYRKHIKYLRIAYLIFFLLLAVFSAAGALLSGFIGLFFITLLFIVESWVIWKVLGKLSNARFILGQETIAYTLGKRNTVIPYGEITKIKISSIRYLGGWIKIKSGKKTIRITVVVENIQELLQVLKGQLESRGLEGKYNDKKMFQFLKTSAFSDESWLRIYRIWWKLALLTILTAAIGIVIGIALNLTGLIVFFSTLFPTIVYIITEFLFKLRIGKLANKKDFSVPKRDVLYERKVYKKALLWGIIIYAVWMSLLIFV